MQRTTTPQASNLVFKTIFSKIDGNTPIPRIFLESTIKVMIGTVIGSTSLGIDQDLQASDAIRFTIINPFNVWGMYYTFQGMDGILYCIKRKLGFLNEQEDTDEMQIAKNPNRYIFKSIGCIVAGGVAFYIANTMAYLMFFEKFEDTPSDIIMDDENSFTDVYPIIHLYYAGMLFIYYRGAANLISGLKNLYCYSKNRRSV